MTTTVESVEEGRMTVIEHLVELRVRLIKCIAAVFIGAIVGFFAYPWIFDILLSPYEKISSNDTITGGRLLQTDPLEAFSIRIKIATYAGVGMSMPVILWQLWAFVSPGLYKHEKRYAVPFMLSAIVLFCMGAGIAYWTLPMALDFLISIGGGGFVTAFSAEKYFQLIMYMMLAFGIGFEFPILLIFLQMAGILDNATLRRFRRHAYVVIMIAVAVATPSGDPISMLALATPMCIFYEVSVVFGRARLRKKAAAEAAAAVEASGGS